MYSRLLFITLTVLSCWQNSFTLAQSLEQLLVDKGVISLDDSHQVESSSKIYWDKSTKLALAETGRTFSFLTFIQTRYRFSDNADEIANSSSFEVNKARFIASGTILRDELDFFFQPDFVSRNINGKKSASLRDAYFDWHAFNVGTFRAGKYKTGLVRNYVTSDARLQFTDIAVPSSYFNQGRQTGAGINMHSENMKYEIGAMLSNGLSNGEGDNTGGADTKHLGVLNLRWNPLGKMNAYEEGDIEYSEDPAVSLGAAYGYSEGDAVFAESVEELSASSQLGNLDLNFKYYGASLHAEWMFSRILIENGEDSVPYGGYIQAGYFLEPERLELATRWSFLECDNPNSGRICASDGGTDVVQQASLGINYYFLRHNLKVQCSYDYTENEYDNPAQAASHSQAVTLQMQIMM